MWRPPTAPDQRVAAMRLYVRGQELCDDGATVQEGIRLLKEAHALAPELELENWPGWAIAMHAELERPTVDCSMRACAPMLVGATPSASFVVDGRSDCVAERVAAAIRAHHFCVLDGFIGPRSARLRDACTAVSGSMRPARAAGADPRTASTRSDWVVWGAEGCLGEMVDRIDELVLQLRGCCPELVSGACRRQRPMLSRFGEGASFARHVDNSCVAGQGPHCNGRVLTTVYYMQDDSWDPQSDGGCLRLFRSQLPVAESEHVPEAAEGADALYDVAPVGDRLLLFMSDYRCPHEVLPVTRAGGERFAATVWYWGAEAVPDWWVDGVHDRTLVELPGCA